MLAGYGPAMGIEFEHFSREPLGSLRSVAQPGGLGVKPLGLWLGVKGEGGWRDWCQSNGQLLDRLVHRYDVSLAPAANVLSITDVAGLDAFDDRFGGHRDDPDGVRESFTGPVAAVRSHFSRNLQARPRYIDWARVAAEYDGIVMTRLFTDRRTDPRLMPWFFTWDAASACIWNMAAIRSLRVAQ